MQPTSPFGENVWEQAQNQAQAGGPRSVVYGQPRQPIGPERARHDALAWRQTPPSQMSGAAGATRGGMTDTLRPASDTMAMTGMTGVLRAANAANAGNAGLMRRRGLVGWWLDLTAPPRPNRTLPIGERERLRKAELTSFSILAVFFLLVSLVSNSLAHPSTAQAVGVMALGLFVAAVLNRAGRTRIAAYLVPSLLTLVIMLAIVRSQGGLQLALLPAYDLLALPVFLVSLTASRRATWVFAALGIAFVLADFVLQPHARITAAGANGFDDIQYAIGQVTWWGEVNRHVALILFAALFSWLGAWSVEAAIVRADRAEEVARLEHYVADSKRQLDQGIQQILDTHIRAANGDFSARAPMNQDNLLWQIAASLNNLLGRLQKTGQAEHHLRRTEGELQRLAAALDDAQMGRRPIWPAPTGTAADLILARIARPTYPPAPARAAATPGYGPYRSGPLGPAPDFINRQTPPRPAPPPMTSPFPPSPPPPTTYSMPAIMSFPDLSPGQQGGAVELPEWLRADPPNQPISAEAPAIEALAPGTEDTDLSRVPWVSSRGPASRTAPLSEVPPPPWLSESESADW